ncbi:hypothetical protein OV090_19085 [Nannocystis sp. RBIL2]|uniref:hypothetical protein n=1 Tax=Nannocystis sp. RBIL2 TaxID=2996788 RepID=UPI002270701B|nr:hypothetical protein [Nannocystis sp. RBIL2]MCY1066884.1 hypothetical protein [Nannocystis sp. RBIL2]
MDPHRPLLLQAGPASVLAGVELADAPALGDLQLLEALLLEQAVGLAAVAQHRLGGPAGATLTWLEGHVGGGGAVAAVGDQQDADARLGAESGGVGDRGVELGVGQLAVAAAAVDAEQQVASGALVGGAGRAERGVSLAEAGDARGAPVVAGGRGLQTGLPPQQAAEEGAAEQQAAEGGEGLKVAHGTAPIGDSG